ncbi:MAG: hypothetical protein M3140_05880, partial [Actinomycetota bacterium]|nr:hypothetical protein [Actinomycetota bacterium]
MSVTTLDAPSSGSGEPAPSSAANPGAPARRVGGGLLDPKMLLTALPGAFAKLDPRTLWKNPVMFVVEIGSIYTT